MFVLSAEIFQWAECMFTCPKLNKAKAPPSSTLQDLEKIIQLSDVFTNFPGSPYGSIWMSVSDNMEEGVWRDHYTGLEASQDLLETVIGGLKENNTAQNCGIVS